MLTLKNIRKDYTAGDVTVQALKGIDISFRRNEFVAVLGPSGCGKTTLLNLIGGLDSATDGELLINGRSTRNYKDRDWDSYRNHSVGFVFQNYNLIPHQTVLANVELALTLSGVSRTKRRKRAEEVLKAVGLGDQLNKKPAQMSGGQMQRVAIARALVNDPDILLADEPTGALDTETSVQVLDILKEVARDRLVIMVTHNPELAAQYATRTVRLLDGRITDDSSPFDASEEAPLTENAAEKKPSMSFFTALSLSLKNLLTKKTRTILTAFAGSIGIIGIALILALSNGVNIYINRVQEDTLSSYPITIRAESVDWGSFLSSMAGMRQDARDGRGHERDAVYESPVTYNLLNLMNSVETNKNNLVDFKKYLDAQHESISGYVSAIDYSYDLDLNIYTLDPEGNIVKSDVEDIIHRAMGAMMGIDEETVDSIDSFYLSGSSASFTEYSGFSNSSVWEELLAGENGDPVNALLFEQYDVIAGSWPKAYNEVVLVVDKDNEINDLVLYSLGLKSTDELVSTLREAYFSGEKIDTSSSGSWSYDDIIGKTFRLVYSADFWQKGPDGAYADISGTELGVQSLYNRGTELRICGIIRQSENAVSGMINGSVGYTRLLTERIIAESSQREVILAQLADPSADVLTGLPFPDPSAAELSVSEKAAAASAYIAGADIAKKAEIYSYITSMPSDEYLSGMLSAAMSSMTRESIEQMILQQYPEYASIISEMDDASLFEYVEKMISERITEEYSAQVQAQLGQYSLDQLSSMLDMLPMSEELLAGIYDEFIPLEYSSSTYEDNLRLLGYTDIESPSSVSIFASTFADKDKISDLIETYNSGVSEANKITYTDYVALIMSSVTTIINAISYVLIAFVAISLVVSSIMIGIITYISVLERTKEIGVLRSIGASKRDISRVFNAETLIVGFCAGIFGIAITLLLCIPINIIVHHLTGIPNISAVLPPAAAVILVVISMLLTLVAGLIPSRLAAKRDPVAALRSE